MGVRSAQGWRVGLLLGLYLVLLVGSPLFCHDLACHIKSPTHCDACQSNPIASGTEPVAGLEGWMTRASAEVETSATRAPRTATLLQVPGRSPPA